MWAIHIPFQVPFISSLKKARTHDTCSIFLLLKLEYLIRYQLTQPISSLHACPSFNIHPRLYLPYPRTLQFRPIPIKSNDYLLIFFLLPTTVIHIILLSLLRLILIRLDIPRPLPATRNPSPRPLHRPQSPRRRLVRRFRPSPR